MQTTLTLETLGGRNAAPSNAPPVSKDSKVHFPPAPLAVPRPEVNPHATKTWVYPSGAYPERRYQFEIVRAALASNCLVCLPTGLGKTFIAAVVMLNFYRFPNSKIVFLAPTRPLVKQQVDACYSIVGIPEEHTIELTGSVNADKRRHAWKTKRVFFMTPQTMENDILRGDCPLQDVVCMVIDEAHRSSKAYAYNLLAKRLQEATNRAARIIGLSATPGSSADAIQTIIDNLFCFRMEFRDEMDRDVTPYIHSRVMHEHVVPLDENMVSLCTMAKEILAKRLNRLCDAEAFHMRSPDNLHKMLLISGRKEWLLRTRNGATLPPAKKGMIEGDFAVANKMAHGIDLLRTHGIVPFGMFLSGVQAGAGEKQWRSDTDLTGSSEFQAISVRVNQLLAAGGGHPKAKVCLDVLVSHFKNLGLEQAKSSRAIVFVEYRDSVAELETILKKEQPLLRCVVFVGQAESKKGGSGGEKGKNKGAAQRGMKQKQQNEAIEGFRRGLFNVLISTSIGEEGLDVGECDIIVMYDASKSPIRMTQRMGRTGRKRDGVIHFLMTKDLEERKLAKMKKSQEELRKMLKDRKRFNFTPAGPRLMESNHIKCERVSLAIAKRICDLTQDAPPEVGVLRPVDPVQARLEEKEMQSKGSTKEEEDFLTIAGYPRMNAEQESASNREKLKTILFHRKGIISVPTPTEYFGHSRTTRLMVSMVQTLDRLASQPVFDTVVPFSRTNVPARPQPYYGPTVAVQSDDTHSDFEKGACPRPKRPANGAVPGDSELGRCTTTDKPDSAFDDPQVAQKNGFEKAKQHGIRAAALMRTAERPRLENGDTRNLRPVDHCDADSGHSAGQQPRPEKPKDFHAADQCALENQEAFSSGRCTPSLDPSETLEVALDRADASAKEDKMNKKLSCEHNQYHENERHLNSDVKDLRPQTRSEAYRCYGEPSNEMGPPPSEIRPAAPKRLLFSEEKSARRVRKRNTTKRSRRILVEDEAELSQGDNQDSTPGDDLNDDSAGSLADFMATDETPAQKTQLFNEYRKSLFNPEETPIERAFNFRRPRGVGHIQDTPEGTPEHGLTSEYENTDPIQGGSSVKRNEQRLEQSDRVAGAARVHRRRIVVQDEDEDNSPFLGGKEKRPLEQKIDVGAPKSPVAGLRPRAIEDFGTTVVVTSKLIGCSVVRSLSLTKGLRCLVRSGLGPVHLVVSSRTAVLRCSIADLAHKGSESNQPLVDATREILTRYKELILIVQDPPDRRGARIYRAREFVHCEIGLVPGITVLTVSSDDEETEMLLRVTQKKEQEGVGLGWMRKDDDAQNEIKFFNTLPQVSYPVANYLATWPGSLRETIRGIMNDSIVQSDPLGLLEQSTLEHCRRIFSRKQ